MRNLNLSPGFQFLDTLEGLSNQRVSRLTVRRKDRLAEPGGGSVCLINQTRKPPAEPRRHRAGPFRPGVNEKHSNGASPNAAEKI